MWRQGIARRWNAEPKAGGTFSAARTRRRPVCSRSSSGSPAGDRRAVFLLARRVLTWWQAAALAGFALVFNLLVLPRIGGRQLYRPADEARGFPLGILLYPASVLLLILAFPSRPDIAAAGWGIFAFGDGAAT